MNWIISYRISNYKKIDSIKKTIYIKEDLLLIQMITVIKRIMNKITVIKIIIIYMNKMRVSKVVYMIKINMIII